MGALLALLICWYSCINGNGQEPDIDRCGIVRQNANPFQDSLILLCTSHERKSGLMMAGFSRELIVDTPEDHDESVRPQLVPLPLFNSRVIVVREAAVSDPLFGENCVPSAAFSRFAPVAIAHIVPHVSSARASHLYDFGIGLLDYLECWPMTFVLDGNSQRYEVAVFLKRNAASRQYLGSINPWSFGGFHLIQLASQRDGSLGGLLPSVIGKSDQQEREQGRKVKRQVVWVSERSTEPAAKYPDLVCQSERGSPGIMPARCF